MCGDASTITLVWADRLSSKRLEARLVVNGRIQSRFTFCAETVDFIINHLTAMRGEFVEETCRAAPEKA